jgi:hypothetical protein
MSKHKKRRSRQMPRERSPKKEQSMKLRLWQDRLAESDVGFGDQVKKMDRRERLYNGDRNIEPLVPGDVGKNGQRKKTSHVRNIIFENIETQISSSIPQPKVTPRRKKDEHLAEIIEHFIRNELNRLPFETINDMAERTVPIQGGVGFLVEWDNAKRTHSTVGELDICLIHPKQFAPQPGVYTSIGDMDWFIIKKPTTKETIRRKYGVNVYSESESEPGIRGVDDATVADAALTQYIGFEWSEDGRINRYSWVNDTELEDLENYQARRQPVCAKCGRPKPLPGQVISNRTKPGNLLPDPVLGSMGGLIPEEVEAGRMLAQQMADGMMDPTVAGEGVLPGVEFKAEEPEQKYDGGACPWCGCEEWSSKEQQYEEIMLPMTTNTGLDIPGTVPGFDEMGLPVMKPTLIPFYKPDVYPIILQRSVSVFGQLLGNSDVDAIEDQQNTINRLEQKIIDRLMKAGTRITLPNKANLRMDPEDGERWYLDNPSDKAMIDVYEFKGSLEYELNYLSRVYEEARQILGITDSFQGRRDPTATSGVAKEVAAAQAAGRLESKRMMKNTAYASIFELMFKFALAYSDEPRRISYRDFKGEMVYEEFNRYDFLEQDADGQYYWNDQFLFSTDTSATLASNREAMWQETRLNLQTGAFGPPQEIDTLILFWEKMEELHYPGAGRTKKYLEDRKRSQMAAQQTMVPAGGDAPGGGLPPQMAQALAQAGAAAP